MCTRCTNVWALPSLKHSIRKDNPHPVEFSNELRCFNGRRHAETLNAYLTYTIRGGYQIEQLLIISLEHMNYPASDP